MEQTSQTIGVYGDVRAVLALLPDEREAMYALMHAHYDHVERAAFERDLAEKQRVILLRDDCGELAGFSTLLWFEIEWRGSPCLILFSGDTIIRADCRNESVLPQLWAQEAFTATQGYAQAYWFLICSGYKTYRFLPVFFRSFYPAYTQAEPNEMQALREHLALLRFPDEYDAKDGIVRLRHATPLRSGVADIADARLRDPHIAFFAQANPGHTQGDELVCLARIAQDNLTSAGRRMLESGKRKT